MLIILKILNSNNHGLRVRWSQLRSQGPMVPINWSVYKVYVTDHEKRTSRFTSATKWERNADYQNKIKKCSWLGKIQFINSVLWDFISFSIFSEMQKKHLFSNEIGIYQIHNECFKFRGADKLLQKIYIFNKISPEKENTSFT